MAPLKAPVVIDAPELRVIVRPVLLTASLKFTVILIGAATVYWPSGVVEVALVMVGGVLSTLKVPLGPAAAALLPARSLAVAAASEMPMVPSPVIELIVTVRVKPLPVTATLPVAVPLKLRVMLPTARVLLLKLVSA